MASDPGFVFIKPLYIHRRRYAILLRRAEISGRTVEAEATRLLNWALIEVVDRQTRGAALVQRIQQLGADREAPNAETQ